MSSFSLDLIITKKYQIFIAHIRRFYKLRQGTHYMKVISVRLSVGPSICGLATPPKCLDNFYLNLENLVGSCHCNSDVSHVVP
jgi:hypothetical protein